MEPMQALLAPFQEYGATASVAIYKISPSVTHVDQLVQTVVARVPRLGSMVQSGQAKVHGVSAEGGSDSLLAIGGMPDSGMMAQVHAAITAAPGVEYVVGVGPGCAALPRTAFGNSIAGAASRPAAKKPWWKVW